MTSNVIVIGVNPTGLFLSYLLGLTGFPTLIIEDWEIEAEDKQISLNQNDLIVFNEILLGELNNNEYSSRKSADFFQELNVLYSHLKDKGIVNISRPVCSISETYFEYILRKRISILKNVTIMKPPTYFCHSRADHRIQLDLEFEKSNFKFLTSLLAICNRNGTPPTNFHSLFLFSYELIKEFFQDKIENSHVNSLNSFREIYHEDY